MSVLFVVFVGVCLLLLLGALVVQWRLAQAGQTLVQSQKAFFSTFRTPDYLALAISAIFALSEALQFATSWIALRLTPNRMNPLWALMLHFYFPLGSLASYKAAWEMVTRPFWWDKTSHGHFDGSGPT